MGDNIAVDWGAGANMNPEGPLGVVNSGYRGALMGYDLGQKRATLNALQGIDLNSPQSIDAGVQGLVHANATEQAGALQNLAFTRALRQQVPALLSKLANGPSQPTATPDTQTANPQHAIETFQLAKGAADKLAATPAEQRPAAFAAIKQDMLSRGIPEAAIDKAGEDLSDQGLASLSQYYGGLLAHASHQVSPQGEAPPVPAAHPSNAWYDQAMADPSVPLSIGMMKSAGLDLSPYLDTAKALALPGVQGAANLQYNPAIAAATAPIEVQKAIATAAGTAPIDVAKAVGTEKGTLPYKAALSQAQADIAAQHDTITVPEVGKDGQPTGRNVVYRKDTALNAGAGGKPIGTAQSPAEATGKGADAKVFLDRYAAEANQQAIVADKNAAATALAGAKLAQSFNPSNITPWKANMANTLNGLGFKVAAADANNLATYQNIIAQNLKSGTTQFPRLTNEFHAVQNASANAKTPADAAALALTETAALRAQAAQEKEFRIQYAAANPGKYSEIDFQKAWAQQPGANQSIFASPLFEGLKFNGQPAVKTYPPYTDGHVYGVFMPGTKQAMQFRVK